MTDPNSGGSVLSSNLVFQPTVPAIGTMISPEPLIRTGRNWTIWAGPIISLLILLAVLQQFRGLDTAHLLQLLPTTPIFWTAFAAYYLAGPISEWVIFRRLWHIPAAGFGALLRRGLLLRMGQA